MAGLLKLNFSVANPDNCLKCLVKTIHVNPVCNSFNLLICQTGYKRNNYAYFILKSIFKNCGKIFKMWKKWGGGGKKSFLFRYIIINDTQINMQFYHFI